MAWIDLLARTKLRWENGNQFKIEPIKAINQSTLDSYSSLLSEKDNLWDTTWFRSA